MHLLLELAAAFLVTIPLFALARALRQRPSMRLRLAFGAFLVLEARVVLLLAVHTVLPVEHPVEELLGFGGDLAVIVMFTAAFLHGTRWSPGRAGLDVA
jgi:hypothetical protein